MEPPDLPPVPPPRTLSRGHTWTNGSQSKIDGAPIRPRRVHTTSSPRYEHHKSRRHTQGRGDSAYIAHGKTQSNPASPSAAAAAAAAHRRDMRRTRSVGTIEEMKDKRKESSFHRGKHTSWTRSLSRTFSGVFGTSPKDKAKAAGGRDLFGGALSSMSMDPAMMPPPPPTKLPMPMLRRQHVVDTSQHDSLRNIGSAHSHAAGNWHRGDRSLARRGLPNVGAAEIARIHRLFDAHDRQCNGWLSPQDFQGLLSNEPCLADGLTLTPAELVETFRILGADMGGEDDDDDGGGGGAEEEEEEEDTVFRYPTKREGSDEGEDEEDVKAGKKKKEAEARRKKTPRLDFTAFARWWVLSSHDYSSVSLSRTSTGMVRGLGQGRGNGNGNGNGVTEDKNDNDDDDDDDDDEVDAHDKLVDRLCAIRDRLSRDYNILFGFSYKDWFRGKDNLDPSVADTWTPTEVQLWFAHQPSLAVVREYLRRDALRTVDGATLFTMDGDDLSEIGVKGMHLDKVLDALAELAAVKNGVDVGLAMESAARMREEEDFQQMGTPRRDDRRGGGRPSSLRLTRQAQAGGGAGMLNPSPQMHKRTSFHRIHHSPASSATGATLTPSPSPHPSPSPSASAAAGDASSLSSAAAAATPRSDATEAGAGGEDEEPYIVKPEEQIWRLSEVIGMGAAGKVYLALDNRNGALMAAKELTLKGANDPAAAEAEAEVDLLRQLRHSNVVHFLGCARVYEEKEDVYKLFVFQEWVAGGSVKKILKRFGALSIDVVRAYTQQLLLGLAYLHNVGVVHRDIKGGNVLVDDRGTVKLADFGVSCLLPDAEAYVTEIKKNTGLAGTPLFMAPEVMMQKGHGIKCDIWSLGCTVIQMATAELPWSGTKYKETFQLMRHIMSDKEARPPCPEHVDADMRDFVKQCTTYDPILRPSAAELQHHPFILANFLDATARMQSGSPQGQGVGGDTTGYSRHRLDSRGDHLRGRGNRRRRRHTSARMKRSHTASSLESGYRSISSSSVSATSFASTSMLSPTTELSPLPPPPPPPPPSLPSTSAALGGHTPPTAGAVAATVLLASSSPNSPLGRLKKEHSKHHITRRNSYTNLENIHPSADSITSPKVRRGKTPSLGGSSSPAGSTRSGLPAVSGEGESHQTLSRVTTAPGKMTSFSESEQRRKRPIRTSKSTKDRKNSHAIDMVSRYDGPSMSMLSRQESWRHIKQTMHAKAHFRRGSVEKLHHHRRTASTMSVDSFGTVDAVEDTETLFARRRRQSSQAQTQVPAYMGQLSPVNSLGSDRRRESVSSLSSINVQKRRARTRTASGETATKAAEAEAAGMGSPGAGTKKAAMKATLARLRTGGGGGAAAAETSPMVEAAAEANGAPAAEDGGVEVAAVAETIISPQRLSLTISTPGSTGSDFDGGTEAPAEEAAEEKRLRMKGFGR